MTKNENTKNKNYVIYARKNFVTIKATKVNIKYTKKLELIVTTPENLEMQPTLSAT